MKEIKLGNVEFTESYTGITPYIIVSFGKEGSGKTRFPLTGPETIGFVPLERKSYSTIQKDANILGKKVIFPKNPEEFIVNSRKAQLLGIPDPKAKTEKEKEEALIAANDRVREYYREHANRIYDVVDAMGSNKDIRLVVIDTFTQHCNIVDSALYGFQTKYIKIKTKTYQDRREYNQEIIDFLNSIPKYGKHFILTHREKDEYNDAGVVTRKIPEGFKFIGNYSNIMLHHESNPKWNPSGDTDNNWHFALSVRTCQFNPELESTDWRRYWTDDGITLANLLTTVDPYIDPDTVS